MARYKLTYEVISATHYPALFYPDGEPRKELIESAPDDIWHSVTRESENAESITTQYEGLLQLIESGHPIRNVTLYAAEDPDWQEIFS